MTLKHIRRIWRRRVVRSRRTDVGYLAKKLQELIPDVLAFKRSHEQWRDMGDPRAKTKALEARSKVRRELRKLERCGYDGVLMKFMTRHHIDPKWLKRRMHTRLR